MKIYSSSFKSKSEVELWIEDLIKNGVADDDILNFLLQKKEELKSNIDFYLKTRRLALVTGDTEVATRLHGLLKESEGELSYIDGVLLNSFYQITKKQALVERKIIFQEGEKKNAVD